jgi:hypothetical protein
VFSKVSAGSFRLPDLRDQFIRATGTDADTANARPLGTLQIEAVRWEKHDVYGLKSGGNIHTLDRAKLGATGISASIGLADSADPGIIYGVVHTGNGSETRSINTALYPRIQI